jgi:outer membrane protein
MNRIIFLLIFTFLGKGFITPSAAQQAASGLTLAQAIDYAKKNNPGLKNSRLDEEMARQKVKEVRSIGLPQISGTGTFNDFLQLPVSLIPGEFFGGQAGTFIPVKFGTKYNVTGALAANQLLFDGTFFLGLRAASEYVHVSTLNVARTAIETEVNVTKAYYQSLLTRENIKLIGQNLGLLEKTAFETGQLYENGLVEKLDVDRLDLAHSQLKLQKKNLEDLLQIADMSLKMQMGMRIDSTIVLADSLENLYQGLTAITEKGDAKNRVELQLVNAMNNLNMMDLKRWKLGYAPSLAAFASYQQNAQRDKFNFLESGQPWFASTVIGVRMNLPIFDGFYKQSKIQQAKITIEKTNNDRINLENGINLEINSARTRYQTALEQIEIQKKNMDLANSIFSTATIKYNEGVGSSLEIVNADSALKTAQSNFLSSLYNLMVAKIDLQKALGITK